AFGRCSLEVRGQIAGLVVDAGVEPQLLCDVAAFVRTAGDADRAATLDLGDLADHGADRAGGCGYDHRLARLGLAHLEQAEIGGPSGHTQAADPALQWRLRRIHLHHALAVGDGITLHAEQTLYGIAGLEGRAVGRLDGTGRIGSHNVAEADRGDV